MAELQDARRRGRGRAPLRREVLLSRCRPLPDCSACDGCLRQRRHRHRRGGGEAMMLQEEIVAALRTRVDAWRGFALGSASEAYPEEAPKYQPSAQGERPVSATTMALLNHWFRHEPH